MRQWLPALGAQRVGVHVAREARSSRGAFLCRVDLCGHRHPPHPRGLPTQGEFSNPTLVFKFKISDFRPFTLKTGETEHMILSQCPPLSGLQFPMWVVVAGGVVSLGLVIQKGLCHGRRGKWGWGVGIHRAGVWRGQRGDEGSRGCPSHGETPPSQGPPFFPHSQDASCSQRPWVPV